MTGSTWNGLKAAAVKKLTNACGLLADHPSERDTLAAVIALSQATLTVRLSECRLEPLLEARPSPAGDAPAQSLLNLVREHATDCATRAIPISSAPFGAWVEESGFCELNIALLERDAHAGDLAIVAKLVATAIRTLSARSAEIGLSHMRNVLERDLPHGLFLRDGLTKVAEWLLAPESNGAPDRATILQRRLQAMSIYGALSETLRVPTVTKVIDDGASLAPVLMEREGLGAAELRALRDARRVRDSIAGPTDLSVAVKELKAHEVPLHEWPGEGRPGRPESWQASLWTQTGRHHFVRPDYLGAKESGVQDAINALRDDLLRPLVAERIRLGGFPRIYRIQSFATTIELPTANGGGEPRRRLLAAIRHAVVGGRKPKAFGEAIDHWHRRVASLSALRHERRAERPGWPALCAPWISTCGRFEIVVLASAADLVEEGRILDHCVGGYYEICRRGDRQILSLREDTRRVATVELKLAESLDLLSLEVGQFKARRNTAPLPHLHEPLREFLRAIRGGGHPVDTQRIARYRKRMRKIWDGAHGTDALTLAHAREVFAFYLPLLPRGTPTSLDEWSETTGLTSALDHALAYLEIARDGLDSPFL